MRTSFYINEIAIVFAEKIPPKFLMSF